jgi:hypothetical protein
MQRFLNEPTGIPLPVRGCREHLSGRDSTLAGIGFPLLAPMREISPIEASLARSVLLRVLREAAARNLSRG